ncbi:SpoIIE family protein phosphatase [Metasolibacillus meyeri]|uniref:SpoIIE family protein phosphatase n=1 Tax=Metasolibacillus meyeri TaxID=1071052 RepID=A0AAW9NQ11_9BACL|nr:SpoIIE family protein phosphatase [Metasolibacillus meyeri]MEC1179752.1 SpoIIE family protein phosphatase [Metasolibacillus meyeri]
MAVLIIGSVSNDILRIQKYFKRIELMNIHSFTTVETAIQFDNLFLKEDIQLIVYDAKLNLTNCEAHCQNIESLKKWSDAPILLSTSYEKPIILDRLFEVGIFDIILKPFDFTHFKTRVHVALKYQIETKLRKQHQDKLAKDLAIAKNVQKSALTPALTLPHIELDGLYVTSHTLGGDMYCWFELDEDLTAVILFDVMGHGVAASLITMSIRSLLKGIITRLIDPVSVMKELNSQIYELFSTDDLDSFLVTAIYMVIDKKNRTLQYVNASHPAGVLFGKYGETVTLTANSPILGLFPAIQVKAKRVRLTGWHRIILYTDGLLTLQDDQEIDLNFFHSYASQNNSYALQKFSQQYELTDQPLEDDVTVVSITITL